MTEVSSEDKQQMLNALRLIGAVTAPLIEEMLETGRAKVQHFKAGQHFCEIGDYPVPVGFVLKGLFRVYVITESGKTYIKRFNAENELVGPYASMIRNEPSTLSIQAIEDSRVIVMDAKQTFPKMLESEVWTLIRLRSAEAYFCERERKEFSQLTMKAEDRYLQFCRENPMLQDRLQQQDIAHYLGISPVSLSRLRKEISKKQNKLT